jgi:3-methyladenine DNA glycosylase AlkD
MIVEMLKKELKKAQKPENLINYQQFFKEKLDEPYGLRSAVLNAISKEAFKQLKGKSWDEILKICDEVLESDIRYKHFFAFDWAVKYEKDFRKSDFSRFESWLNKYVDNWGACDSLCGLIGRLVSKYPDLSTKVKKWTKSRNRWFKRASAVSLINAVNDGKLLDEVFKTADILLLDEDDMVQKGYGWMLKVASKCFPDEVFEYVMKHKHEMPRTALRYAIEKYPQAKRKLAMS